MSIKNYKEIFIHYIEISDNSLPNKVYLSLPVLFYVAVLCIVLGLELKFKKEIMKAI